MAVSSAAPRIAAEGTSLRDGPLWGAAAAFAALYFALGAVRYASHRNYVDLGIFAQTASSAFGCFCNTIEGSHWAFHFSPILYVAGALMRVWPSALALVALQAVAGALVAPAVYGIAIRHTDRRIARLAAAVTFLYPPLGGLIFNDFHENGLVPAAVAWTLWAFDGGYRKTTIAFALLTLAMKEDQAIFLAALAVVGFLRYRGTATRAPAALVVAVLATAVAFKFFAEIQPQASLHAMWAPQRFYAWTAADARALLPRGLLERAGFLLLAFGPLLFVPFRTRAWIVLILPLAEVLGSRMSTTFTMGSHYAGAWIGYAVFAFALGIRAMYARDPVRTRKALVWCVALCVIEFAVADPLHPGTLLKLPGARDAALDRFLSGLPRDISVATQEEAYAHIAATDPRATLLPESSAAGVSSCYVLIDGAYPDSPRLVESAAVLRRMVATGAARAVRSDGPIILYKTRRCRG